MAHHPRSPSGSSLVNRGLPATWPAGIQARATGSDEAQTVQEGDQDVAFYFSFFSFVPKKIPEKHSPPTSPKSDMSLLLDVCFLPPQAPLPRRGPLHRCLPGLARAHGGLWFTTRPCPATTLGPECAPRPCVQLRGANEHEGRGATPTALL